MIRTLIAATLLACSPTVAHAQAVVPDKTQLAPVATQTSHLTIVSTMGDGPPVILIPGLSSPRAVWDGIMPEIAKTHRVYLVQVRGFAGDDPGENVKPGVLNGIVADLDGFITRNRLEKPAVIGHSMGGLAGMMLAARHPDKVGRLMVVDALPFIGTLFGAENVAAIVPQAERLRTAAIAAPRATAPVTTDPGGIWSNTVAGRIKVANWSLKADPRASGQAMYDAMTTDVRPELGKITAKPFTIVYATGAGPQVEPIWKAAYAGSPATLVPVPDSWHFIMLDQPRRFADAVQAFLSR